MPDKMTPERALIVLNQCNTDGRIKVDREELKQAVKMACEAIKTHKIKISPWLGHTMGGNPFWACPRCMPAQGHGTILNVKPGEKYCHACGQALDWSDYR
jgi:hypothetical protein